MKLKYNDVKPYRLDALKAQNNTCALCNELVEEGEAVLDHCHKTGRIRKVLHRGCNALLGKIENNMPRNRVTMRRLKGIAHNLVNYLERDYQDIIHPTYKTVEERKDATRKRIKNRKKSQKQNKTAKA